MPALTGSRNDSAASMGLKMIKKISFFSLLILLSACLALYAPARGQEASNQRKTPVVMAVQKVGPAVVNISTEKIVKRRSAFASPFFDPFFGIHDDEYYDTYVKENSLGSGVMIHSQGYIITNEHVIRRATDITVRLSDKSEYKASLISFDVEKDLALLKVARRDAFVYAEMGIADDIMVGEPVIAVGNPFGLENSVTTGVISAKNRSLMVQGRETYKNMLQTDALINFGNSGGALLNINGELIGINTAIQAQGQGIGFAIPVSAVKEGLCYLSDFRKEKPYHLGIDCDTLREANPSLGQGLQIHTLKRDSAAWASGLREGDFLYEINNTRIPNLFTFNLVVRKGLGKNLEVSYLREEKKRKVSIPFPPIPQDTLLLWDTWGIQVEELDDNIRNKVKYSRNTIYRNPSRGILRGVKVGDAGVHILRMAEGKPARLIGIEEGDILVALGEYLVEKGRLMDILKEYRSTRQEILIYRNGEFLTGQIDVP